MGNKTLTWIGLYIAFASGSPFIVGAWFNMDIPQARRHVAATLRHLRKHRKVTSHAVTILPR